MRACIYTSSTAHGGGRSLKDRKRRGELLLRIHGRASPLMDRKVVGVVFFGGLAMVAAVTSPTTAACSVVKCSCSCSWSVVEL